MPDHPRRLDLTHPLRAGMPVYPGTEPPSISVAATLAEHGFEERRLEMFSHTGTHMDAPAHIIEGAPRLDALEVGRFMGPGCVVDVAGAEITLEALRPHAARIEAAHLLVLRSGWWRRWGTPAYFEGFPVLTEAAARWLTTMGLSGIGVDMISVDAVTSEALPIHHVLLGAGLLLVENLTALDDLPLKGFELACLPLRIADGDGSPIRAVATLR